MATPDIEKAKDRASTVLKENFIQEPPINVRELAKNYELEVRDIELPVNANNVAGFIDPEKRIIYVNASDSMTRRNFTVAHELGHWLLHQEQLKSEPDKYAVLYRIPLGAPNSDPVETEANVFAANLLVPEEMISMYPDDSNAELAQRFCVSTSVIGYRKKDISTAPHVPERNHTTV